jgi:hypothetical protein
LKGRRAHPAAGLPILDGVELFSLDFEAGGGRLHHAPLAHWYRVTYLITHPARERASKGTTRNQPPAATPRRARSESLQLRRESEPDRDRFAEASAVGMRALRELVRGVLSAASASSIGASVTS